MSISRDRAEATLWLNAAWIAKLGDQFGRLERARLALIGDKDKRERVRRLLLTNAAAGMSEKKRGEVYDEIIEAMPRRLRRALGERSYSQAGRHMAVPKGRR